MKSGATMSSLVRRLERSGSVRFDEFVEHAHYDVDDGFFATGGGAGRAGADFVTSPEVGPLFGAVVARALDTCWDELGRPDPFVVVEAAAGRGALAIAVLAAAPRCAPALRYVLVERSAELRARQRDHLEVVEPFEVLGPDPDPDTTLPDETLPDEALPDEALRDAGGSGPLVTSLAELPSVRVQGVLLANELLDNVPFRLLERTAEGWGEVFVVLDRDGSLGEVVVPAEDTVVELADRLAPDATVGARIPLQAGASRWLRRALDVVERGRLIVVDYCSTTPELAARPAQEWLRTYRAHGRGGPPLLAPGSQDITCEVAVDQLAAVDGPTLETTQADWLRRHGLEELVDEGRRIWAEGAHAPDLHTIRGRSRVVEAEALTDPTGLGAFTVLEWDRS